MAQYILKPSASASDQRYLLSGGAQANTETFGRIGQDDGGAKNYMALRPDVSALSGATVTSAYLKLTVKAKPTGSGKSFVGSIGYAPFVYVDWTFNVSGMTVGGTLTSPDIATIIQYMIDTPETYFNVSYGDAAKGEYFDIEVYDGAEGEDAWEIEVTYTPPEPVVMSGDGTLGLALAFGGSTLQVETHELTPAGAARQEVESSACVTDDDYALLNDGTTEYDGFFRFQWNGLLHLNNLLDCYLRELGVGNIPSGAVVELRFEEADNSSAFVTGEDLRARSWSTGYVEWTLDPTHSGMTLSPDLSTLFATWRARPGVAGGDHFAIYVKGVTLPQPYHWLGEYGLSPTFVLAARPASVSGGIALALAAGGAAGTVVEAEGGIDLVLGGRASTYPPTGAGNIQLPLAIAGAVVRDIAADGTLMLALDVAGQVVKDVTASGQIVLVSGFAAAAGKVREAEGALVLAPVTLTGAAGKVREAEGAIAFPMPFHGTAQHFVTLYPGGAWQQQWQIELDPDAVTLPALWQRQWGEPISMGIGFALAALWQEQWQSPVDTVDPGVVLAPLWQEQWESEIDDIPVLPPLWQEQWGGEVAEIEKEAAVSLAPLWQEQWESEIDDIPQLAPLWQEQWTGDAPAVPVGGGGKVLFSVDKPVVVFAASKPVVTGEWSKPRVTFEVEGVEHG